MPSKLSAEMGHLLIEPVSMLNQNVLLEILLMVCTKHIFISEKKTLKKCAKQSLILKMIKMHILEI